MRGPALTEMTILAVLLMPANQALAEQGPSHSRIEGPARSERITLAMRGEEPEATPAPDQPRRPPAAVPCTLPGPGCRPVLSAPTSDRLGDADLGLTKDPAFRSAKVLRNVGITTFSLLMAGSFAAFVCAVAWWAEDGPPGINGEAALYSSLGLASGALALGVPMWIVGQVRMNSLRQARRAQIVPLLSAGPQGGTVGIRWQF